FCSWPILSGLLLQITVSLGGSLIYGTGSGPLATIASALLMTASAIATPVLANHLIGGSVKSAPAHGAQTAAGLATKGLSLYKSAFGVAKAASRGPAGAAAGAAAMAARAASNLPGSPK